MKRPAAIIRDLCLSATLIAAVATRPALAAPAQPAAGFVPPPRTIADITAILDQEKPDAAKIAQLTAAANAQPGPGLDERAMAEFLLARGGAALTLGRSQQSLADLGKAVDLAKHGTDNAQTINALIQLSQAERRAGDSAHMLQHQQEAAADAIAARTRLPILFTTYRDLAVEAVRNGKVDEATKWLKRLDQTQVDSAKWHGPQLEHYHSWWRYFVDYAHAFVLDATGDFKDAEPLYRQAIAEARQAEQDAAGVPGATPSSYVTAGDLGEMQLASALARRGRLLEAEIEAREALLSQLHIRGRYAAESVSGVNTLGRIIGMQGRFPEAEKLERTAVETYQTLGFAANSAALLSARDVLAATLLAQGNLKGGVAEFANVAKGMGDDAKLRTRYLDTDADYSVALIESGNASQAAPLAQAAVAVRTAVMGPKSYGTAEAQGIYASALFGSGNSGAARDAFANAVPVLLAASRHNDDEEDDNSAGYQTWRLQFILESYLDLLARERTSEAGEQAFQLADAARGQAVQRAVADAAARANVHDPALAEIVRQDQDAQRQVTALDALEAGMLALSSDQRDAAALKQTRDQIDALLAQRAKTRQDIRQRFPDYAQLIDPRPATVADTQKALQPGETLFSAYIGRSHVYLWAVPKQGPVAFAVSSLSPSDIEKSVATLRKSLDPDAATAGDIPAFDVATAYKLYAGLLEPVKAGWQGASDLLVVTNGALEQVPFALLATQDMKPAPDQNGQPLFSGYKSVPWLIRQLAITQLPSVTSLTTLRAVPAAQAVRKPFIGFGDPWFSKKEEAQAIAQQGTLLALEIAGGGVVAMRKAPVHLRSAPKTEGVNQADLAELPRLPDTADEVRDVAVALKANPAKDVYLGTQANEQVVRTVDLNDRRVVMFATHGLVPGDLDGLTEPALALTAPDVAKVPGDGLLTVSKILGLRLNADWVVLSACNTAAGNGAGADAVSGLGLAFFYAGSRALLVSNWPVETTSARLLTSQLFQREAASPGVARAETLRQAMLALIDGPGFIDPVSKTPVYSYAHPLFWAPFSLVGDGGAA